MERRRQTKGFTLVELIVVLIILGILAALLLPTLTGYIEQARRTRAIAECRECVMAADSIGGQYYASERKAMPFVDNDDNETAILELAEQSGDITELTMNGAGVQKLVYKCTDGRVVTYENGKFTLDGDAADDPEPSPDPSPSPDPDEPSEGYKTENLTEQGIADNMRLLLKNYNTMLAEKLKTAGYTGDISNVTALGGSTKNGVLSVTYRAGVLDYITVEISTEELGLTDGVSDLSVTLIGHQLKLKSDTYTTTKDGEKQTWYIALDGKSNPTHRN